MSICLFVLLKRLTSLLGLAFHCRLGRKNIKTYFTFLNVAYGLVQHTVLCNIRSCETKLLGIIHTSAVTGDSAHNINRFETIELA